MVENDLLMTNREKAKTCILVIEKDTTERNNLKTAMKNVGFENISDASDVDLAFEKLSQRHFTHVIFNVEELSMPIDSFIKRLTEIENDVAAIACLPQPDIDHIFEMMIHGARGFLVKPFTFESIETSISMATKGEPINSLVLQAKDRNEALVAVMMASVDNMANILKQSHQFETAKREIPRYFSNLNNTVALAHTFAKGGDEGLIQSLESFCIERSKNLASRRDKMRTRVGKI